MGPRHHRPETLDEAYALMASAEEPMVYGGGTAVQILIKQGVLFASDLVDLGRVPGLTEITETASGLRVGAMVTLRQMERDPLVRRVVPLAAQVYGEVANPRVRNTASVGGNIAHGDYRLDPPTALLALDARVEIGSSRGTRHVPAREFFVDFQTTALEPGEIVTALEVPRQPEAAGAWFAKLSSLAVNDWPCASACALVVDAARGARQVRLGLGALAHIPLYTQFELPAGTDADAAVEAARQAAEPLIDPIPDIRGGAAYKKRLGLVAVEEALRLSWKEQRDDQRVFLRNWRRRR
jgi:carbon-monoxide dehydrogenase medium subunit